jgi:hypothetical protein
MSPEEEAAEKEKKKQAQAVADEASHAAVGTCFFLQQQLIPIVVTLSS